MEGELVSVIMSMYNSEKTISRSVFSILNQTHKNIELIITDDYSTDRCVEIIKSFIKKDNRIKLYILKKNSGAGVARNNSIKFATGRYIAFCDSDDIWKKNKLKEQIFFLKKHNLTFTCSAYEIINENDEIINYFKPSKIISYNSLLYTSEIGCLTAIYDTKKIKKYYMSEIRSRQDYELWLRIFSNIGSTKAMQTFLAQYRIRKGSISRNKFKNSLIHFNILLKHQKLNFFICCYYFLWYTYYGIKKNYIISRKI